MHASTPSVCKVRAQWYARPYSVPLIEPDTDARNNTDSIGPDTDDARNNTGSIESDNDDTRINTGSIGPDTDARNNTDTETN